MSGKLFLGQELLVRIGPAAIAACVACLPLLTAGCNRTESATPPPEARPPAVAVDIDPAESDLSSIDPNEFIASVTGRAVQTGAAAGTQEPETPQDLERRQALWWYLMMAGILLLATETILSNRISKV